MSGVGFVGIVGIGRGVRRFEFGVHFGRAGTFTERICTPKTRDVCVNSFTNKDFHNRLKKGLVSSKIGDCSV